MCMKNVCLKSGGDCRMCGERREYDTLVNILFQCYYVGQLMCVFVSIINQIMLDVMKGVIVLISALHAYDICLWDSIFYCFLLSSCPYLC